MEGHRGLKGAAMKSLRWHQQEVASYSTKPAFSVQLILYLYEEYGTTLLVIIEAPTVLIRRFPKTRGHFQEFL